MHWLYAILKGFIQGATEFIPVSSSAHLVLFRYVMDTFGWDAALPNPLVDEFFDIALHLGTLLAVVIYFRAEIGRFLMAVLQKRVYTTDATGQSWRVKPLLVGIIVAFLTTSFLSLFGLKTSEKLLTTFGGNFPLLAGIPDLTQFYIHYPVFVALNLLVTGGFLWYAEQATAPPIGLPKPSPKAFYLLPVRAFGIGVAQSCAALFRGISRSGSTMAMGVLLGMNRTQAARFSFWLSIPIFCSAALYESLKLAQHGIALNELPWGPIVAGTMVSFVTGYACIAWLLAILSRSPLSVFSYYCWGVGLFMLWFMLN
jgi:undecaprenyl-diphosphatase